MMRPTLPSPSDRGNTHAEYVKLPISFSVAFASTVATSLDPSKLSALAKRPGLVQPLVVLQLSVVQAKLASVAAEAPALSAAVVPDDPVLPNVSVDSTW